MFRAMIQWRAFAAAMLSLSIGWGIRGNFGHEAGAMLPGALCAIAVCLFSGREDWHRRVTFFAMFGALGWGFGGSIAYMPPLAYTHTGHLATQLYGFFGCFTIGFLWAGMGGAGTAYAALEREERLGEIVRPLAFVLAIWALQYFLQDPLTTWYESLRGSGASDTRDFRHNDPFYWLDSEWIEAGTALLALCAWELWDRRFDRAGHLAAITAAGAAVGWAVQAALNALGWMEPILKQIVRPQGDLSLINPATGQPYPVEQFITNWPQVFFDLGGHMGWILGAIAGAAIFFARYGRWRCQSSLLLHITIGSMVVFVAGPVLLSRFFEPVGGFRLQPPRGDSWANTLGSFIGMAIYMRRNRLGAVATSALMSGILGGLGLMAAQFGKILAFMPGNPARTSDAAEIARWAHWHSANWHSIATEQGVGLLYGLAIALPLFWLARWAGRDEGSTAPGWTHAFAVVFVLNVIPFLNLAKNPGDWLKAKAVPESMKAPLLKFIELPSQAWYDLAFLLFAAATILLLRTYLRQGLEAVPASWAGKGQLLFVLLLWIMVIGNFERALVAFNANRLATEWSVFVNGLIVTLLVLATRYARWPEVRQLPELNRLTWRTAAAGALALVILTGVFTSVVRGVYGDRHDGWGRANLRLGPQADWRVRPTLRSQAHR